MIKIVKIRGLKTKIVIIKEVDISNKKDMRKKNKKLENPNKR